MKKKTYFWLTGLLVLTVGNLYFILPAYRDYRDACKDVTELKRHWMQQQQEIQRLDREIRALRADPDAVERVAREKFGWCRDGEKVYHFEYASPQPTLPSTRTAQPAKGQKKHRSTAE